MKKVVDVVNLNADASCLSTESWFSILKGGTSSALYNFLNTYVHLRKKISLGIIGATLVDMVKWNPEAVALIRGHRDIFEIILRPFAHDVALLRSPEGFAINFRCGRMTLERELGKIEPYFLPPEFMLTNYQIAQLVSFGVQGTFVNANRFTADVKRKIPAVPYMVRGVNQTSLACIPMYGELTKCYLDSIHYYSAEPWNKRILSGSPDVYFSWRDGESPFLIPDGNERERSWLASESPDIERLFVSEASKLAQPVAVTAGSGEGLQSYPVHSFLAWVKEFRMLGYVQKVSAYEERLKQLTVEEVALWLAMINSDILSAVEKTSPVVTLQDRSTGKDHSFTIWRSERGFEGEEYLYILDNLHANPGLVQGSLPHVQRLANRSAYLTMILNQHDGAH